MSAVSSIEWTDRTWNPVTGCTKVSQGCKHCYAEGVAGRFWSSQYAHTVERGFIATKDYRGGEHLTGTLRKFGDVMTHADRLFEPLAWRRPARVFVNSMSDLFHDAVPFEFIDRVFAVMALCPHLSFQVLTKRPARMRAYLETFECDGDGQRLNGPMSDFLGNDLTPRLRKRIERGISACLGVDFDDEGDEMQVETLDWPLPNVWLGVSVEDQATADARIPLLLETPSAIRFVSYEPALGPVNFGELPSRFDHGDGQGLCNRPLLRLNALKGGHWCGGQFGPETARLDWVIVGGESGPGARPFQIEWARSTVRACQAAGVAVFVKQLGAVPLVPAARLRHWEWGGEIRSDREARFTDYQASVSDPRMWRVRLDDRKGGDPAEWPEDLRVRQFPGDAR